jgi:enamine deaminase RidA (YjgF/YER057c/UK114 family)
MQLSRYTIGSIGEETFGFCQAVRRGPHVAVSGSTGRDVDGHIVPGGAYAQTRQAIENLQTALAAVGGSLADVIRTRVFIVDMTEWESVARAHCEAFAQHPPARSLIGVNALFEPDILVEIEADAIIADGS